MYIFASHSMGLGDAAIYSLVSIVLVFAVLLVIIGITSLVFTFINMIKTKNPHAFEKKNKDKKEENKAVEPVNITDDDMMAAVLVCSIDYRNEIKKDVKVVSVKEIK